MPTRQEVNATAHSGAAIFDSLADVTVPQPSRFRAGGGGELRDSVLDEFMGMSATKGTVPP